MALNLKDGQKDTANGAFHSEWMPVDTKHLRAGEDSGQHVNNFLWVTYNIDTKTLSRLMSIPAGGESTGLHAVDEINGWTYISSNFQHAGDWGGIHNVVKDTLDPLIKANYKGKFAAAVAYLTGTPTQMKLG